MFPFAFEWVNDASHFVFMGSLYTVLVLLGILVNYAAIRALFDCLCKKDQHGHH